MKKIVFLTLVCISVIGFLNAQNAWINEIHYNNTGTDQGEFIEVVIEDASSFNLADFEISLYNGNNSEVYDTKSLDQYSEGATSENFTLYYYMYPENGIQNGDEDGMALSYQGTLIEGQFLSYQGTLTGANGPAAGVTSDDIGVYEDSSTPAGESLQLAGTGTMYGEFLWQWPSAETPGELNNEQSFGSFTPDPEPTNYPTDFTADGGSFNVSVTWTDATGEQLPLKYLLLASENNQFTDPVDGSPVEDDTDLSDGSASVNVPYGEEGYNFSNLPQATTYYFTIYPYTNGNEYIDYKTDGNPPEAEATTSNTVIILSEDFEDQTLGVFSEYSVLGDQVWENDSYGGDYFAKISGYAGGTFYVNEDWLISPPVNMYNYHSETLQFITAKNYTGPGIEVKISTDYDGESDPNTANWSDLEEAVLSPGNWEWTESGEVDISGFEGETVYIAFKFTSTDTESETWEVDNIMITGVENVGTKEITSFDLSVFPNPVRTKATVEVENGRYLLKLMSMDGRLISELNFTGGSYELDMSELERGIYLIVLEELSEKSRSIKKITLL